MTLKFGADGKQAFANDIRNNLLNGSAKLRLFKNNVTPSDSSVLADFTEADFNGYAAITMTWPSNSSMFGTKARITANTYTFTKSVGGTGNNIYGYYVTNFGGTVLWWAEADPNAPINMSTDGNTYTVLSRVDFDNL